jgi:hypothetical protein
VLLIASDIDAWWNTTLSNASLVKLWPDLTRQRAIWQWDFQHIEGEIIITSILKVPKMNIYAKGSS